MCARVRVCTSLSLLMVRLTGGSCEKVLCLSVTNTVVSAICLHKFSPLHTCTPAHAHTRTRAHLHTCTPAQLHNCTTAHLHTRTPAHLHTCLHTCTPAHLHPCTPAHLHTCTPAHLHTCTPAHVHTCTLAHLHRDGARGQGRGLRGLMTFIENPMFAPKARVCDFIEMFVTLMIP